MIASLNSSVRAIKNLSHNYGTGRFACKPPKGVFSRTRDASRPDNGCGPRRYATLLSRRPPKSIHNPYTPPQSHRLRLSLRALTGATSLHHRFNDIIPVCAPFVNLSGHILKASPHNSATRRAISFRHLQHANFPPANLCNLHLHLTKNPLADRPPHSCGAALNLRSAKIVSGSVPQQPPISLAPRAIRISIASANASAVIS